MSDPSSKTETKASSLDVTKPKGYFIAISTAKPGESVSIVYIPSKQDDCHTK